MHPDTLTFLDVLFQRCASLRSSARLTFTVIHPNSPQSTPSRHIPLDNRAMLLDMLQRLSDTNQMGWGAYFAVGLRQPGLTRWQRGGLPDILALPALYADIDDPTEVTLNKLRGTRLPPSLIVWSGGGYHAYWLLDEPTTDLHLARQVLQGLARTFGGDSLSPAQSLRLPGTVNTKPERSRAVCRLIEHADCYYDLSDFAPFLAPSGLTISHRCPIPNQRVTSRRLNPTLIEAITTILYRDYAAREQRRSDWIAALCPCGHTRDRPGSHYRLRALSWTAWHAAADGSVFRSGYQRCRLRRSLYTIILIPKHEEQR